ncbi:MAG: HAMP domain-containing protein, partial [Treponema sp.]|nr:HAMP domain-containing protein [Treponema sp.]
MKIGKKLIIMIIALTLLGTGTLLGTILYRSQKQIAALTNSELRNLANNEAAKLSLWIESYFSIARSLAQSMEAYEEIEPARRRFFYNMLLRRMAEANPELAAVWTIWEPNALDGLDAEYANTEGTDSSGRFLPTWSRTSTGAEVQFSQGYDADDADFYNIPMRTGNETAVEPFFYTINGVDILITSLVVPIKKNGRAIGVAGVDLSLTRIQAATEEINPYTDSAASVFTNGALVAGYFDPAELGKTMDEAYEYVAGVYLDDMKAAIKNGTEFDFTNDVDVNGVIMRYEVLSVPLAIGKTGTPWSLAIGVPQKVINAPVTGMLRLSVIISAVMLLVIAAAAFFIARSISNPIKYMMTIFTGIGEGDLTRQLDIQRNDEIGDMARVFNGTLDNIRTLVVTIKNQSAALFDVG